MRPDGVVAATSRLALSGVENEYIVDNPVAVGIVLCEIDFVVDQLASLDNHIFRVSVAVGCISTIIFSRPRECDRSNDIELRSEASAGVFFEVVVGRAGSAIVGKTGLIEHAVEIVVRIRQSHFDVGIFNQNHQSPWRA